MTQPKRKRVPQPAVEDSTAAVVSIDGERWESLDKMSHRKREWFWPGLVPAHSLTIIQGSKGVGKSTMLAQLVAACAGTIKLPGVRRRREGQGTLYLVREESYETDVLPRLLSLDVPAKLVHRERRDPLTGMHRTCYLGSELEGLTDFVTRHNIGLIVCDPCGGLIPPVDPRGSAASIRSILEPIVSWCIQRRVTLVTTQHLRKGRTGSALEAGLGALEWSNVARSVLRCSAHPSEDGQFVLSRLAGNGSTRRSAIGYEIVADDEGTTRTVWGSDTSLSMEDIIDGTDDPVTADEKKDATTLLKEIIGTEWIRVREIQREGEDAMISLRTLKDRKKKLGCQSRRVRRDGVMCWEWGPPQEGWSAD